MTGSDSHKPQNDLKDSDRERELSGLMVSALDGDREAYRTLLYKIRDLVTDFVANIQRKYGIADEAGKEDLVQEILLAVHDKRSSFDRTQFFLPWVFAIARYKTIDSLRSHGRRRGHISLEDSGDLEEFGLWFEWSASMDVEVLLGKLPEKQAILLRMVKLEEMSIRETASKTGYSESDVKVSIHRAMATLRSMVEAMLEDRHES